MFFNCDKVKWKQSSALINLRVRMQSQTPYLNDEKPRAEGQRKGKEKWGRELPSLQAPISGTGEGDKRGADGWREATIRGYFV